MYVGIPTNACGTAGTWYTVGIEIPARTPGKMIERVATDKLRRLLDAEGAAAAFFGVYYVRQEGDE